MSTIINESAFPEDVFSKEILLLIRDFVMERKSPTVSVFPPEDLDLRMFYWYENERSWRSFLCTHNSVQWKAMRRETLFWRLNGEYSWKYIKDVEFRDAMKGKVENTRQQLWLSFRDVPELKDKDIAVAVFRDLYGIDFADYENNSLHKIPALENIGYLLLHHCKALKRAVLGPGIEMVSLHSDASFAPLEIQEGIKELHIPAGLLRVSVCRSLETLELFVNEDGLDNKFPKFTEENYPCLRHLEISGDGDSEENVIPMIELPKLESLKVYNYWIRDISKCNSIHSLDLEAMPRVLKGRQQLKNLKELKLMNNRPLHLHFPLQFFKKQKNLQSFSLKGYNHGEMMNEILMLMNSLRKLEIQNCDDKAIYLGRKVKELSLSFWNGEFTNQEVPEMVHRGVDVNKNHEDKQRKMEDDDEEEDNDEEDEDDEEEENDEEDDDDDDEEEEDDDEGDEEEEDEDEMEEVFEAEELEENGDDDEEEDGDRYVVAEHSFIRVHLSNCAMSDYSFFRNTQELSIHSSDIKDISSIAHLPVLSFNNCKGIKDFRPLENYSHKFIEILYCNLKTKDVPYLTTTYYLRILGNDPITSIDTRKWPDDHRVRVLKFSGSRKLESVTIDNRVTFELIDLVDVKNFKFISVPSSSSSRTTNLVANLLRMDPESPIPKNAKSFVKKVIPRSPFY